MSTERLSVHVFAGRKLNIFQYCAGRQLNVCQYMYVLDVNWTSFSIVLDVNWTSVSTCMCWTSTERLLVHVCARRQLNVFVQDVKWMSFSTCVCRMLTECILVHVCTMCWTSTECLLVHVSSDHAKHQPHVFRYVYNVQNVNEMFQYMYMYARTGRQQNAFYYMYARTGRQQNVFQYICMTSIKCPSIACAPIFSRVLTVPQPCIFQF